MQINRSHFHLVFVETYIKINLNLDSFPYSGQQTWFWFFPLFLKQTKKKWTLKAAACERQKNQPLFPSKNHRLFSRFYKKTRTHLLSISRQGVTLQLPLKFWPHYPIILVTISFLVLFQITGSHISSDELGKYLSHTGSSQQSAELGMGDSAPGFIHLDQVPTHKHKYEPWIQTQKLVMCHGYQAQGKVCQEIL